VRLPYTIGDHLLVSTYAMVLEKRIYVGDSNAWNRPSLATFEYRRRQCDDIAGISLCHTNVLKQLYLGILGRDADEGGLG
jgi:hypothetical protein